MMRMLLSALLALFVAGTHLSAADLQLEAGIAKVDITPSSFGPMYGYTNRKCGPANGTHDPLFAKALVLAAGDSRLAIVTLDLGSIVSENLKRDVAAKLGIPVLLLSVSHTHSGPSFLPTEERAPGATPPSAYQVEMGFSARFARQLCRCSLRASESVTDPCSSAITGCCCATTDAPALCSTIWNACRTGRSIPTSHSCA